MVGDGVLDYSEQFFLRVDRSDGEAVQQLDHETGKPFERSGNAHGRADLNEDALGGMDVDLESAGFVDGGIEEGKEALFVLIHRSL